FHFLRADYAQDELIQPDRDYRRYLTGPEATGGTRSAGKSEAQAVCPSSYPRIVSAFSTRRPTTVATAIAVAARLRRVTRQGTLAARARAAMSAPRIYGSTALGEKVRPIVYSSRKNSARLRMSAAN